MHHEAIGVATKIPPAEDPASGVLFKLPYGEDEYHILLSNEDMDTLLRCGFEKMLGNQALEGFDYTVDLLPDLPLYVGVRSLEVIPTSSKRNKIRTWIGVVTQSVVNEHRGILVADREGWEGAWSYFSYGASPPLRHAPELLRV